MGIVRAIYLRTSTGFLLALLLLGCPPGAPTPEPVLEITHDGEQRPWAIYFHELQNLSPYLLCDDPLPTDDCINNCGGTAPGDTFEVTMTEGSNMMNALLDPPLDTAEWRRDRIMFFQDCKTCARTLGDLSTSDVGRFRSGGIYFSLEGLGQRAVDLGMSVGHIRRYRRGACSAQDSLQPLVDEFAPGFADGPITQCDSGWLLPPPAERVDILDSSARIHLGTASCQEPDGENYDFIELKNHFLVVPNGTFWANAVFELYWSLRFRIVAQPRSRYLDCPEAGEYGLCNAPDCQTVQCATDDDCCGLPGVACRPESATSERLQMVNGATCVEGVCQKKSFLDVVDHSMHFSIKAWDPCKWDAACMIVLDGLRDEFRKLRNNTEYRYKKVFAPLIQGAYDQAWEEVEVEELPDFGACNSDDDCEFGIGYNFQGRCNHDAGKCELRPMYFYGVNLYPTDLELVLAWNADTDQYPEHYLLSLGGKCEHQEFMELSWGALWLHYF